MRRLVLVALVLTLLLASFAPAFAQYGGGQTIHIVERGETLGSIAAEFGVSVQALASANHLWNPDIVWAGMRLVIPYGGNPSGNPGYPPPSNSNYYTVRWGDTLAGIASYFGISPWSLAQSNHIYNLNQIYAGMSLYIPGGNGNTGYPPPPPQNHSTQYWIKPGDTLAIIAWKFGTTVQALVNYNNISNPDQIYWGMLINIPAY